MSTVLLPPQIVTVDGPLIFLAGPIQGAPDWQSHAIRRLKAAAPDVTIASPRREYPPDEFDYAAQVNWETHYIRLAAQQGVILFWLAREALVLPDRCYAQTSRFELADWKVRHERDGVRLVVGIEDGFSGERYIRQRFGQDCPQVPIISSLDQACDAAVDLVRRGSSCRG